MPMKGTIFKGILLILFLGVGETAVYSQQQQRKDTLVVTRDGTGDYRNIQEAVEAVRAFMDYTVTIYIKNGTYKEKLVIPSWVKNVQLVGESAENTIITYDDHANINKMGTFRTYTVKVSGNDITFKDLTIENNAAPLGQAVALHTEGDRLMFINCRFLGNQDTIYTGSEGARLLFTNCYIEGTTDFIFGPSTALFEYCELHSKRDSYITAASTPQNIEFGYVFKNCKLTAAPGVKKVYLGRPWRPYAATAFINCEFGNHIRPEGWHNWKNPENEKTARYAEFGNTGEGAKTEGRVAWAEQLTKKEVLKYTPENIFKEDEVLKVKIKDEYRVKETHANEIIEAIRIDEGELNKRAIQYAKIESEQESLYNRLNSELNLTLAEAKEIALDVYDVNELKDEISNLKGKIAALGTVNLSAIVEYDEVCEKYEFMSSQELDLQKAKEELIGVIEEMTIQMQEVFKENFKILNENFGETFRELFKGGKAELILGGDDILNSNIIINVEPPGKKLQNINLMSGGEKVLSAIALLFAILKMKPTPFCILDEIEAALDDANVYRYAEFLKQFSENIQFIVITHRKGTMEASDVMYGITMEEKGISKIVSVDLSEN